MSSPVRPRVVYQTQHEALSHMKISEVGAIADPAFLAKFYENSKTYSLLTGNCITDGTASTASLALDQYPKRIGQRAFGTITATNMYGPKLTALCAYFAKAETAAKVRVSEVLAGPALIVPYAGKISCIGAVSDEVCSQPFGFDSATVTAYGFAESLEWATTADYYSGELAIGSSLGVGQLPESLQAQIQVAGSFGAVEGQVYRLFGAADATQLKDTWAEAMEASSANAAAQVVLGSLTAYPQPN